MASLDHTGHTRDCKYGLEKSGTASPEVSPAEWDIFVDSQFKETLK